jgi:hypothetical protein
MIPPVPDFLVVWQRCKTEILPPGLSVSGKAKGTIGHQWNCQGSWISCQPNVCVRPTFYRHLMCIPGFLSTIVNVYHLSIGYSGSTGNHRIDSQATTHIQDFLSRLNVGMQMWIPYSLGIVDIWSFSFKIFLLVSQMIRVSSRF